MKVIGLTGGIASGKSTVSQFIKDAGFIVIDADVVAREIVEKGRPALEDIVVYFGKEVLNRDGTLNRKYLGDIVFSDPQKLKALNKITHKRIIENILNKIDYYKNNTNIDVIFLDAALLIEMNMQDIADEIWLVSVDKNIQIDRLMNRDKISYEEALKRINSQMSLDNKKKYADIIINNTKNIKYLKKQVDELIQSICGGA